MASYEQFRRVTANPVGASVRLCHLYSGPQCAYYLKGFCLKLPSIVLLICPIANGLNCMLNIMIVGIE